VACKLCGTQVLLNAMRNHVARHIFLQKHGIVDPLVVSFQQYVGEDLCGWCGLDGCQNVLMKKGKTLSTASDCEYHYVCMSYSSACSSSHTSSSTNIPIHCTLC
ncbi:hypothetical protein BDP27DRAFT_1152563, partial [Rhodocollybia butyracea]